MGVKKAVEKLVVLVTWNYDGLAKRFSGKNWKEYLGIEKGWDNKHEKLDVVCKWSCNKGNQKNNSSYLIEEKLRILLFSCCIQIERWTSTRKYYTAAFFPGGRRGKAEENKEMYKLSYILHEIWQIYTELNMNGVWKNILPFCICFSASRIWPRKDFHSMI